MIPKLECWPTNQFTIRHGVMARIWKGKSETGISFVLLVASMGLDESLSQDHADESAESLLREAGGVLRKADLTKIEAALRTMPAGTVFEVGGGS